jgi:hypothetical protein
MSQLATPCLGTTSTSLLHLPPCLFFILSFMAWGYYLVA